MSRFLNIDGCSLFLEIVLFVLKNEFGFSDDDVDDFVCAVDLRLDSIFEDRFGGEF